jgi:hypothetical protein
VDRQQRVRSATMHVSNILSEDGRQERAVPTVGIPVQQLRRHIRLKLSTSSPSLSLSLRLGLSMGLHLSLSLSLSPSLSLFHSCSCIQKLNIELKTDKKVSRFFKLKNKFSKLNNYFSKLKNKFSRFSKLQS